jgi:hypothetical protein
MLKLLLVLIVLGLTAVHDFVIGLPGGPPGRSAVAARGPRRAGPPVWLGLLILALGLLIVLIAVILLQL